MKQIAILAAGLLAISAPAHARSYQICHQKFALCAASPSTPTGKMITVNVEGGGTAQFPEAMAVCPVLNGPAIADVAGGNLKGSCDQPGPNQVWSLYQYRDKFPQAPNWSRSDVATIRTFTTSAGNGLSNMFSFACTLEPKRVGTVKLAKCYGPINENIAGAPVVSGTLVVTQAPTGATYPVGGPIPQ
jgi:hypothetical protein